MAIFDTVTSSSEAGIGAVSNFQERTNEDTLSLVEIQNALVLLRTPEIYAFRVFTESQSRYAPAGRFLHSFPLLDSSESGATQNLLQTGSSKEDPAVLGLLEIG